MYNSFNRIQNVFGFFTTVACVFGAFIAATDLFSPRAPSGVLSPDNVQVYVFFSFGARARGLPTTPPS